MAKSYSIANIQKSNINEYRPFDAHHKDDISNFSPTYIEILNIFKEAFKLVDITHVIKRK